MEHRFSMLESKDFEFCRHCEERSDEAIYKYSKNRFLVFSKI
ncbi:MULTISPECIES: hypothetical protein [unclassified Helicobacter]|nr:MULTISPECIES: hypothetical protein [unclassified Helicobacter]